MYAVLETGSKQYRVVAGDTLEIERLAVEAGKPFTFDRVLLVLAFSALFAAFQCARSEANQNDIFLWDTAARTVRTRPRIGLSTHEANCRSGDPIAPGHPAALDAIH